MSGLAVLGPVVVTVVGYGWYRIWGAEASRGHGTQVSACPRWTQFGQGKVPEHRLLEVRQARQAA